MLLRSMDGWLESLDAGMKEGEGGYHRVFLKVGRGLFVQGELVHYRKSSLQQ